MDEEIEHSVYKIIKGAGIVFISIIVGMIFSFSSKVILVRMLTQSEYGTYSICVALVNIFTMVSLLGLPTAVTRLIAYYKSKERSKVGKIITFSIVAVILASTFFTIFLFLISDILSNTVFHNTELSPMLKIFVFTIPISAAIYIFVSFYRGFERVKESAYFQNFATPFIFFISLLLLWFLKVPFMYVAYVYVGSFLLTIIFFIIYIKRHPPPIRLRMFDKHVGKEIVLFSLPLLFTAVLGMIMNWMGTLTIGFFEEPSSVGLYNAAMPLARLILILSGSAGLLFNPLMSDFYSKKMISEMKRVYQIITKWIFSATLPLFLILFAFSGFVLNFIFGPDYTTSSIVLKILSIGFMLRTLMGLNDLSLIVIGKPRFIMFSTFCGAVANIFLNFILIPLYGIVGAAVSSTVSYTLVCTLNSLKLYNETGIYPFTKNYLKPMTIGFFLVILIDYISSIITVNLWIIPLILFIFLALYVILLFLTKSFDKEDIVLLLRIEKKAGLDLRFIKKILKKFV